MGTELLFADDVVSCFRDIKPGAPHHYLVVPSKHVGNCKSLGKEHIPLVERMVQTGKEMLQKNNMVDLDDVRFGFHWPPFCSVSHLHLHVLAPASQMSFMSRLFYRLNSYWFITADQLIQHLNSKGDSNWEMDPCWSWWFEDLVRLAVWIHFLYSEPWLVSMAISMVLSWNEKLKPHPEKSELYLILGSN